MSARQAEQFPSSCSFSQAEQWCAWRGAAQSLGGLCQVLLASLAKAVHEMDPATFCRFLHALGSAVWFKTSCCFSSRRDIVSVHKARFIEGWIHAKEFKFRSNTRCDCRQQARACTNHVHRYCVLPLLPVPPTRVDNHSSKNAFFFACLFYHPPFPSSLSISVWQ